MLKTLIYEKPRFKNMHRSSHPSSSIQPAQVKVAVYAETASAQNQQALKLGIGLVLLGLAGFLAQLLGGLTY